MGKQIAEVFIHLPGATEKDLAGVFDLDDQLALGKFTYDRAYLGRQNSYAIDPIHMRLSATAKETRSRGVFGVLLDAGPDAWGRDCIIRDQGVVGEIGILKAGPGDGIGNLSFVREKPLQCFSLEEIDRVSVGFPPENHTIEQAVQQTTSMGGAKPKLLVFDAGKFWIAKFPEKGDPEVKNAANENAMLQLAHTCGIDACNSRVHTLPDGRKIILVERFDLSGDPGRHFKTGYASAHTVLGMGDPRQDGKLKSYPLLAYAARRWCGNSVDEALWTRMAFNALVSNTDDHAKNHGFIYDDEWRLSKAFDIVASPTMGPIRHCLSLSSKGVIASIENLILAADEMCVAREFAIPKLLNMSGIILNGWQAAVGDGMSASSKSTLGVAFKLAESVATEDMGRFAEKPRQPKRFSRKVN